MLCFKDRSRTEEKSLPPWQQHDQGRQAALNRPSSSPSPWGDLRQLRVVVTRHAAAPFRRNRGFGNRGLRQGPEFGAAIRSQFMMDFDDQIYLNQGSRGVVPREVMEYKVGLMTEMESSPDLWWRSRQREHYNRSLGVTAAYLGANPADVVFVNNATTGLNVVLKSWPFQPGDIILLNSHTYGSVPKMCEVVGAQTGAAIMTLELQFPIETEEQVVELFVNACLANPTIRMVVLDHISSGAAIVFPIAKIAAAVKGLGILVLVDGAHAPGNVPVNCEELGSQGVDFYVGNIHKWSYAPRGCAVIWVRPEYQSMISPLVTSHNYGLSFQDQFFEQGTMDTTNYMASEAAIAFYNSLGGYESAREYTENLLEWARGSMSEAWGGTGYFPVPMSMQAPFMKLVEIPPLSASVDLPTELNLARVIAVISNLEGKSWFRLSGNVWNTEEDYETLRDLVAELMTRP